MFRHVQKFQAHAAPTKLRWVPLGLAAGLLLSTFLLCKASSFIEPRRVRAESHASAAILASVRDSVERKGFEAVRVSGIDGEQESWSFRNLRHRFASSFGDQGWDLSPIPPLPTRMNEPSREDQKWRWRYQFSSLARDVGSQEVGAAKVSAREATVTLERSGGVKEWYKNAPSGIEQGFEIRDRPLGTHAGELILRGTVETDLSLISEDAASLTFGRAGQALVRYAELVVFDSTGKTLPSRLSFERGAGGGQLALHIDDSQAKYPVTVDPVTSSPLWTADGPGAGAEFGFSVASAGDVNGDGFSDVIVGAPEHSNGEVGEGLVYLFLGSASGPATAPSAILESNDAEADFGYSVSSAGDVNDDGYSDVIVGAPRSTSCGYANAGAAFLYLGSAPGLVLSPAWTGSSCVGNFFGRSVTNAGDVNNDGFSDVIVGCPGCLSMASLDGNAFLFVGSGSGLSTSAAWAFNTDDGSPGAASFGQSVAGAGDVDGDGFSDILVGAPNWFGAGYGFLFRGSAGGLSSSFDWSHTLTTPVVTNVSGAGDVNGDGFDDILVGAGAFNISGQNGLVELFLGSVSGPSTMADWTKTGSGTDANAVSFGDSMAPAGDINGDGYDDVLIGDSLYGAGAAQNGRAFLFLGSAAGLATTDAWIATGDQSGQGLGTSVARAGDVNGDGYPDAIVGSPGRDSLSGRASVWSDFNIARPTPTPTPTPTTTPTPTPISVSPGGGGLPAPAVTTSGRSATITAPKVTPKLTTRARNASVKKLMAAGLTRAQALKASVDKKIIVTYIFTVTQGGAASAASDEQVGIQRSSIIRRDKRNRVTFNNLPAGAKTAKYQIELSVRIPGGRNVVLGTTRPSGRTPFTITR